MYDRDPRAAWSPLMADIYGRQPETMIHLTPAELDSLVKRTKAAANALARAAAEAPSGRHR